MATVRSKEKPMLNDQMLRCEQLDFQCKIVHNATPANKTFSSDIPGVSLLRAQGQTAAVDAVEVLPWTTPVDASGIFGLYLAIGTSVTPSLGPVATNENFADKVYKVEVLKPVVDANGNMTSFSILSSTGPGGSANAYLTPLGNIAVEITDGNLATTDENLVLRVSYREMIK